MKQILGKFRPAAKRTIAWCGLATSLMLVLGTAGCREKLRFPATTDILGRWQAIGTSHKDTRTYSGIYNFHSLGQHTYDIVLSNGTAKKGRGVWSLEEEQGTLRVENDAGSIYIGTFERGKPGSVSLFTINNQWGVRLDKESSPTPDKTATR